MSTAYILPDPTRRSARLLPLDVRPSCGSGRTGLLPARGQGRRPKLPSLSIAQGPVTHHQVDRPVAQPGQRLRQAGRTLNIPSCRSQSGHQLQSRCSGIINDQRPGRTSPSQSGIHHCGALARRLCDRSVPRTLRDCGIEHGQQARGELADLQIIGNPTRGAPSSYRQNDPPTLPLAQQLQQSLIAPDRHVDQGDIAALKPAILNDLVREGIVTSMGENNLSHSLQRNGQAKRSHSKMGAFDNRSLLGS